MKCGTCECEIEVGLVHDGFSCIDALKKRGANLEFVRETLRIATERYQKAEALNVRYRKSILALLDSMKD